MGKLKNPNAAMNLPQMGLKKLEQDDDKRVFIGKALNNILAVSRTSEN